ncbi:MAG TPA: erythromycin esterase family protein, partial [Kofleriaceae bacterium]
MQFSLVTALCVSLLACASPESATREHAVVASPEVTDWITAQQIPLTTVEAGNGFADLAPLVTTLGDAHVVSLGEATHGSREFFQLKHRLIEYLVTQRGFRVLAFEAGFAEGLDVEDYVVNGRGDPARAVAGLGYWPWMTEEVLALVEWMRTYNRTHQDKVHFVGIDMQVPDRALREVLAYLRTVDPAAAARFATSLHMATSRYDYFTLDPDQLETLRVEAEALLAVLDARSSSSAEWRRNRQLARVVVQAITMLIADYTGDEVEGSNIRDAAMADNLMWIREGDPAAKIVAWAHNDHVSKGAWLPGFVSLGAHLAERLGDDLRVFGFAFDDGEFQALGANLRLRPFTVDSGGPETVDATLAAAAAPIAILPLIDVPAGPVADYFATPPLHRDIGAGYLDFIPEAYFREVHVADFFDALSFVATTTRARPLIYANDQITPQGTNPAPLDLGFETGTAGWFQPIANAVSGYTVATSHAQPYEGKASAALIRNNQRTYGKNYGELRQRILATGYAGKRVRLRSAVRAVLAPGARVHMWMRAGGAYDGMHDRPIGTSVTWQAHEIVL